MAEEEKKEICGIVMPISAIDNCSESHWADVQEIIAESIEQAGFEANLVSNADDAGIIHKRIIQNLYDNPIVVCDVSGKNPNVMFELGLRLAFDKPTVIIKDEKTSYSFDTSAIEHLEYPRDLRFSRIVEFKQKLAEKIAATHRKATTDPNYTTFLKHFGEFKVAKLDKKEVSGQEYILEELRTLRFAMRRLETGSHSRDMSPESKHYRSNIGDLDICLLDWSDARIEHTIAKVRSHPQIREMILQERGKNHKHIIARLVAGADLAELEAFFGEKSRPKRSLPKKIADSI